MLHCFLLLSNLLGFLQLRKTFLDFFSSNMVQLDLDLDPDPHSEKLLGPDTDPDKMNADPQPCFELILYLVVPHTSHHPGKVAIKSSLQQSQASETIHFRSLLVSFLGLFTRHSALIMLWSDF